MATVRPFAAIRPRVDMAQTIAALPYDIYNRAEATSHVKRFPHSFLAVDRADALFPPEVSEYDPRVYQKAHDLLWEWIDEGLFVRDGAPYYYIYEENMDGRAQTGIVACASIDDYENGVIKKHETTRAEKEQDRINHVDACNAQTGPIFLAYRRNNSIEDVVRRYKDQKPIYDFTTLDHISHRVWIVSEPEDIEIIRRAFEGIDSIYIADGHHRAASAVKVGLKRRAEHPGYTGDEEFNYFLSVLFPDDELKIFDYNRVLKDMNGHDFFDILSDVKDVAELHRQGRAPIKPQFKGSFSMYLDNTWYNFSFRQELRSEDPIKGLDVSLLQNLILEPVFGIKDPKTDPRIDFVGGIRGLKELERRCHEDCSVAFAMYPTSISELFAVADAGKLMPPKSTWFEPKLRSGLFIHEL
ncbi:MAG: DUF1015 domain-containing protein [Lachnospiraceae bacterium]|uniref:DUF1015 domain-containing protein n=1 Tax=Candidatus Weimeria bifida TaxID=2599074 RepID=A0A6N7IZ22_9FIRM|nr:DUF1015 domain-containing protein [Candidatus Weimeria bifida]RRF96650.1 MAG: DUF1015 domain-containing protein [Lachnospiraceae bacterium]